MRRTFLIAAVLGILVVLAVREVRLRVHAPLGDAYVGVQGATVWNSTAEVRAPRATLNFGDRVEIFARHGNYVEMHTAGGIRGWVSSGRLLEPSVWKDAQSLAQQTRGMPVEAHGYTQVRSNLHTAPGRDSPVIFQAFPNVPVALFQRRTARRPPSHSSIEDRDSRSEDWWLVRARVKGVGDVSGWLLGSFVKLALPDPLRRYENSEAMKVVAWFEINRAVTLSGAPKPEYLVMATRGGGGQPCDFKLVRVYTWDPVHGHYVTAFIQNGLCGSLPVAVSPAAQPGGEAHFEFRNVTLSGAESCAYQMKDTFVRRLRQPGPAGETKSRE